VELPLPRHPDAAPLFPFGHGLSYTTFEITDLRLSSSSVSSKGSLKASVNVTNTGSIPGDEVVQLYIHDPVASISQPCAVSRGFERVTLSPGETQTVTFTLDRVTSASTTTAASSSSSLARSTRLRRQQLDADLTQSFTVRR
jgi:beta-glucosidase